MSPSVRTIAERDFRDPFRSQAVWPTLLLFGLLFGLAVYAQRFGGADRSLGSMLRSLVYLFVPLVALQFGYDRIAGPRESGEIRLLLAPPHSRRDLLVGTFLGRVAFLATSLVVGFLTALAVFAVTVGVPAVGPTLGGFGAALAFGVSVLAVALGISASVSTVGRAGVLAVGAFFLLFLFWSSIPTAIRYLANGLAVPPGRPPEWVSVFAETSPFAAYQNLTAATLPNATPADVVTGTPLAAAGLLLAWTVLPLLVGYLRLQRTDL